MRDALTGGKPHVFEAELKEQRRTNGHPAHTSRPDHLEDNMHAGVGPLPDAAMRDRIAALLT